MRLIIRPPKIIAVITGYGNAATVLGLGSKGQFTVAGFGYDFNDNYIIYPQALNKLGKKAKSWF